MSELVLTNIGELFTNSTNEVLHNAAIVARNGVIEWVGPANSLAATDTAPVDVQGQAVIPGFVDSHAHLVFAGERSAEFAARMNGEKYTGGGIRTTVAATRSASDDALRANTARLVREMRACGITTFEIKSGYGLDVETETRLLRIAGEFTDEVTYLGAHVVPTEFVESRDEYVDLVVGPMLETAAPHAKWIDVFCEEGAFTVAESHRILQAGIAAGLKPRIHTNQLTAGAGVALAVELGCASADHLTHINAQDIDLLAGSHTVATLLPGAEFSTRSPYPPARALLDAGVTVAIATDCNPGSSFTSNMPFCIALAVREMRMSPAEALRAATLGGAAALQRTDIGVIAPGYQADLVWLDAPSYVHLAYRPGVPIVHRTWARGKEVA